MIFIDMVEFRNTCIPLMYRPVEWNIATKPASRQGCILNRMQGTDVMVFSTERRIPNGIQFPKFKPLLILIMLSIFPSCQKNKMIDEVIVQRIFQDIKIENLPTTYFIGQKPDFKDVIVKEVFADGYEKINTDYDIKWNWDIFKIGADSITVTARGKTKTIKIVIENQLIDTGLPVVYIETEDGKTIDSKTDYINAKMTVTTNIGRTLHQNDMRIRGRGHATWIVYPKKPYRLKLDNKTNLLGMGEDKDWALLAGYCDKTLMRTSIAFKLSELLGFPWTPKSQFVELVLNGEYMGNYMLVEAVKQDAKRIDIPKAGFVIERNGYYLEEPVWFTTIKGHGFTFKNPDTDVLTETQINYIRNHINEFENILYSASFNDPVNGYSKYIHTESFVRWFLFQQIIANMDTNPYIVKDDMTGASKLSMGPVWDFEWSLGIGWYDGFRPRPADYWVWYEGFYFQRLLQDAAFARQLQQMWEKYNSSVKQDILQYISATEQKIMKSQELNFQRWDIMNQRVSVGGIPMGSFEKEVDCDRQFFINHINWLQTALYQF
jgi:spore coat protein CotH